MFVSSWVQIPALYTGWTFFTLICCKNYILCWIRPKKTKKVLKATKDYSLSDEFEVHRYITLGTYTWKPHLAHRFKSQKAFISAPLLFLKALSPFYVSFYPLDCSGIVSAAAPGTSSTALCLHPTRLLWKVWSPERKPGWKFCLGMQQAECPSNEHWIENCFNYIEK